MIDEVRRALATIRSLREKLSLLESDGDEPVAILGMGLRLPGGVKDGPSLWKLLTSGQDAVGPIPASRWTRQASESIPPFGAFLDEDLDRFDRSFWAIHPREAKGMDPQQRLSLELTWEAIEDAGLPLESLRGKKVGVYIGCTGSDFAVQRRQDPQSLNEYSGTGVAGSMLANRISRHFDFRGPSLTIDAACASSMFAMQVAAEHLKAGTCELAVVGGVSLMLDPGPSEIFHASGMLAEDGKARVFDAQAQGFVRGEGGVFLVLKRSDPNGSALPQARALLHSIATNQDGRSGGLTVPRAEAHTQIARETLHQGGLDPKDVGFLELHASGTVVGDPIEVSAMDRIYGQHDRPIWIGSVKSHLGHTEGACGLVSVAKAITSLERRTVPPQVHYRSSNPNLGLEASSLAVPTEPRAWPENAPLAAVHSYGYGGTNVHAILGPAPAVDPCPPTGPWVLWISAADPDAVRARCAQLGAQLDQGVDASALCRWWNPTRSRQRWSVLIHAASGEALREALRDPPEPSERELEPMDWGSLYGDQPPSRVEVPPYPWQYEVLVGPVEPASISATGLTGDALVARIAIRCGEVLGFPEAVDTGQPLAEHGWDSMAAVRLVQRLAEDGLRLPLHLLTDGPSPTVIAGLVVPLKHTPEPTSAGSVNARHLWISHLLVLLIGAGLALGAASIAKRLVPDGGVWLAKPPPLVEPPAVTPSPIP